MAISYGSSHPPSGHTPEIISREAQEDSRRDAIWGLTELLVVCKFDPVDEDSFDEDFEDDKLETDNYTEGLDQMLPCVELVFKYQQRQFVFVALFLGHYSRVVRFDRAGIITSERIGYMKRGPELTEFFVRYARLQPADRGHDPTATRILPTGLLAKQLKRHGLDAAERDPEDYVQKFFNKSLDPQWPWWKLLVPDEESGVKRWFAVGKPHFRADGVTGRGTRGYVAVPLNDTGDGVKIQTGFVYLKDAWRVDHEGLEREGMVLKALNDAKVPYVPTLLCHGDLDQRTVSDDKRLDYHQGKTREESPPKSHQHYRLIVAEVGKPLSEFQNGFYLVWALFCCISGMCSRASFYLVANSYTSTAHKDACSAGYIHRDISAGNILLYKDEIGDWAGLLNDWELSAKCVDGKTQASRSPVQRVVRSPSTS